MSQALKLPRQFPCNFLYIAIFRLIILPYYICLQRILFLFRMPSQKPLTSAIWQHCADLPTDGPLLNDNGERIWRCRICKAKKRPRKEWEYKMTGGSSGPRKHMKAKHRIDVESTSDIHQRQDQEAVDSMHGFITVHRSAKRHKLAVAQEASTSQPAVNMPLLTESFLRWLVHDNIPLTISESASFRAFLETMNPLANALMPRSARTTKMDLKRALLLRRPIIKEALQQALSKIHLIPDNWTSPNGLGICGVMAIFVHAEYGLLSLQLGFTSTCYRSAFSVPRVLDHRNAAPIRLAFYRAHLLFDCLPDCSRIRFAPVFPLNSGRIDRTVQRIGHPLWRRIHRGKGSYVAWLAIRRCAGNICI